MPLELYSNVWATGWSLVGEPPDVFLALVPYPFKETHSAIIRQRPSFERCARAACQKSSPKQIIDRKKKTKTEEKKKKSSWAVCLFKYLVSHGTDHKRTEGFAILLLLKGHKRHVGDVLPIGNGAKPMPGTNTPAAASEAVLLMSRLFASKMSVLGLRNRRPPVRGFAKRTFRYAATRLPEAFVLRYADTCLEYPRSTSPGGGVPF